MFNFFLNVLWLLLSIIAICAIVITVCIALSLLIYIIKNGFTYDNNDKKNKNGGGK